VYRTRRTEYGERIGTCISMLGTEQKYDFEFFDLKLTGHKDAVQSIQS
jgi:hypothetical protein